MTLDPPTYWQRGSALSCACRDCVELARFLSDPGARIWEFKVAVARRSNVEVLIRTAGSDTSTVHQGSPYRLVCVKNQASYERRVKQRKQDIIKMELLESGPQ